MISQSIIQLHLIYKILLFKIYNYFEFNSQISFTNCVIPFHFNNYAIFSKINYTVYISNYSKEYKIVLQLGQGTF